MKQLHQRDEERERNITKRVQEFEKTFDFVNSHLLKGVATMAELTKTDNRQPIGKIKPTDKMVMMLSLFDCTKPATSKQHYKRFNLYINFQTKSGHLTDPVGEAIDLFKHTLDKTVLVWFQMNRSKFKDLTMLKTMFLQRYNPWGKTKREQLQSWNILSFDPKNTDVDEHICCALARPPVFLSTMPHLPSSLDGTRNCKALNGSRSSECGHRTPPSKSNTTLFLHGKASANQRLSRH